MAWTPTLPADLEKLKDSPAIFRAMWAAIATGTDPALLITNDKVSPTAGIVDTKLAQIATASKVSGTALTGLASIPSGAGVIPVTNIPDLAASKITTGQLAIARGGTNLSSAGGNANRVLLTADGSTFAMGQVALATMVTGTLPTGNGGTGSTANANAANGVVVLDANSKLPAVDGSQLTGIVTTKSQLFTSSGNFTAPAGVTKVYVTLVGGGGGGGDGNGGSGYAGGGGGGAYAIKTCIPVTPASSYTVTVGSGGAKGANTQTGSTGGASSFAGDSSMTITCNGGLGGGGGATGRAGGAGGAANTAPNMASFVGQSGVGQAGNGGAGGGSIGGKGGPTNTGGVGANGTGYGAGGAGGHYATAGGNGTGGFVLVEW